ncbi:lyase [Nannocystis pusilla]|uniref:Vgb family protein n=1 Tax=Nannocystis pusilla TaxID=889268 RepID=UPI003B773627
MWVANTSQGSISKVNTTTLIEEGRYYADPNPAGASSSRTSVNIDGHFVVVSNRASYSVTKFAADKGDCVDKNGDGVITTSSNKDDLLPWGSDECMLWNTPVSPPPFGYNGGPRGTAWAPGDFNPATCKYDDQKVWVGWLDAPTHAIIGRFDGVTGVQDATIPLDNWTSQISPYGAAADGNGYVWFINVYQELVRIDTETLEVKRYPGEGIQFYGMTVDGKGNVWFGPYNNGNVAMFDAQTETFHQVPNSAENHRGLAVDGNGMAWVAANAGGTHGCGLNQIDTNTMTAVQFHTFEQCSTPVGVSIDVDGFVWMVDYGGWAYRIDPETYAKTQVLIAGDHYTYSDMTGGGLFNAVMPG